MSRGALFHQHAGPDAAQELELARNMRVRRQYEKDVDIIFPLDSLGATNPVKSGSTS